MADSYDAPLIVLGAGGHAKVLVGALLKLGEKIVGLLDRDVDRHHGHVLGIEILGDDLMLTRFPPARTRLVNGLGSMRAVTVRRTIYDRWCAAGYRFVSVIDPHAVLAADVLCGIGVQVMAGAILQPGIRLGDNCIINTGAVVDHDCTIGAHAHIAPGAVLSGGVTIGAAAHVGTGASIIQGISIGAGAVVGAGATVIRDVEPGDKVAGCPARSIRSAGNSSSLTG